MKITIKGFEQKSFNKPVSIFEIAEHYAHNFKSPITAAIVDDNLRELTYTLEQDCTVDFLDMTTEVGMKIYLRSLIFLFVKACYDVFPDGKVHVEHSLGKSLYCELIRSEPLSEDDVKCIENRMCELVKEDLPIKKSKIPLEDALTLFRKEGMEDKVRVLKYRKDKFLNIYELDGMKDYFYGYMVPSTRYLKWFRLKFYLPGIILQYPSRKNPTHVASTEQPKLSSIFRDLIGLIYWCA